MHISSTRRIWAPFEANCLKKYWSFPTELLGYLPFDLIGEKAPDHLPNFRDHDYLIHQYQISYSYSATLLELMQQNHPSSRQKKFIAFAPSFPHAGSIRIEYAGFTSRCNGAPHSQHKEEVEQIQSLMGGDISFWIADATESRFKSSVSNYQVVHIASHARVNDKNPLYSRIMFSAEEDSLEDGSLHVSELFNLDLPVEMVVFSACETGIGKLFEGEGIVSLARGASYAGHKVSSLPCGVLMMPLPQRSCNIFIKHLNKGYTKRYGLENGKKRVFVKE